MYGKPVSHAMTRTVEVIHSLLPEELMRKGIYLMSRCSFWENLSGKCQMALEDQSVVFLLFLCRLSEKQGTGDVGCSACVLSAGIQDKKSVSCNGDVGLFRGAVMDHGTMGSESGYGIE